MARTLNVSEGGILMETHQPLKKGQQVMITMGLEDSLINIMGRIIYSKGESGRYQNGIEFFHVATSDRKVLREYVKIFNEYFKES